MDISRHNSNNRKRSRSPYQGARDAEDGNSKDVKRQRSRSPRRHHHYERRKDLPFKSRHLHKHDFESYKAVFAEYLDLQKGIDLTDLDDHEARGRWKSFLGKWNRSELAKGWYDPEMKRKLDERYQEMPRRPSPPRRYGSKRDEATTENEVESDEDNDDGYGPMLPRSGTKSGPSIPNFQDLQQQREQAEEDRDNRIADLRYERKQDRALQKDRLEELAPRATPGTRERQVEKKRENAASNRAFADAKEAGDQDVGENDLMGDDVDDLKKRKKAQERQKNEREIRKEEILRAREAEREERLAEHRKKEEKTMEYLRSLAQQRFGGSN